MKPRVDRTKFAQLFHSGTSAKLIAEELGCNTATVWRIHRALSLPPFEGTQNWMTPDRKQRIEAMLDDGYSFAEIRRTEGAHPETLRKHFPGRHWTQAQQSDYTRMTREVRNIKPWAKKAVA